MATYKVVDADKLDADLTSIADKFRTYTGSAQATEFPDGFRGEVDVVYELGNAAGYGLGRFEGHIEGYDEGYSIGYSEGNQAGYNDGYDDGYEEGTKSSIPEDLDSVLTEQEALIDELKTVLQGKVNGGGEEVVLQSKTVTPSKSAQEVTADEGYTALEKVTVEAIPSEYIVPSGTKTITENGTHDAKAFESVSVNVPIPDGYIQPNGTLDVTENGTHDVTAYASVNVNVEASGGDPKALLDAALNNTLTAIDSNVTSIVGHACRGLSKLKTVNLPNATSIGTYAFYGCTALTSINAPNVSSLGTYSLYNCKISYVNFPKVTTIAQNSFYDCDLVKADFGVANKINQAAFAYCTTLEALILRKSDAICTLSVASNAFTSTPIANGTGYIYVPSALIETYKTATNWVNYASQFRAIEDYPDICGGE